MRLVFCVGYGEPEMQATSRILMFLEISETPNIRKRTDTDFK